MGWKKEKARKALADEETTVPMGRFIDQGREGESVACPGIAFTLDLIEGRGGKKTEGESADSRCADEKMKG